MTKFSKFFFLTIIFLGLFGLAEKSFAVDYFVSPTGAASWQNCDAPAKSGTAACSWQTAMANAVADDVVYFRGGTYNPGTAGIPDYEYPGMNPANSGTSGHPITFKAYPGETPTILGTVTGASFGAGHRDYIVWNGFSGTAVNSGAVTNYAILNHSTGSKIINSNFSGFTQNNAVNTMIIQLAICTDCEVSNNVLHDMSGTGVNTAAIWVFQSTRALIHNNTIYNCANGIMQKTGPHVGHRYYNNLIIGAIAYSIFLNEQASGGDDVWVYQNVIINSVDSGVHLEGVSSSATTNNYLVYNNTIYGSGRGITLTSYARSTQIYNNIVSGSGSPFLRYYTGDAIPAYSNYNNFYGLGVWNLNYSTNYSTIDTWRTATGFDTNSITTSPGFVNAGGTTAADYKRTSYPTNGRGGSYASVMGAYIIGDESIGYSAPAQGDTTAPNAPTGLSVS